MSKAQPNLPGAGVTVRFVRDDGLTFIGVTLGGELYTPGAAAAKLAAAAGLSTAEQARARNVAITMTHQPREPFQEGQGWAYYRFGATTQLYVARDDGTHMSWGVSAPLFTPGRATTALAASTTLSASELARLSAAVGYSVTTAGAVAAPGSLIATTFPIAPTVQYHANTSAKLYRTTTTITGYIVGTTMTVTGLTGFALIEGQVLTSGASAGTKIVKGLTATGEVGTYVVDTSQTAYSSGTPGSFTTDAQQVTSLADLKGLADLTSPDGNGPILMTDAAGRPFLRFIAPFNFIGSWLRNLSYPTAGDTGNMTWLAVVRVHSPTTLQTLIGIGAKENANGVGGNLVVNGGFPQIQAANTAFQNPAGLNRLLVGTQMQVIGSATASDDGVNGAGSTMLAKVIVNETQATVTVTGARFKNKVGFELGKAATANTNLSSSQYAFMDLYELAGWVTGEMGNTSQMPARAAAAQAAMMANHNIPVITDSLVMLGDSRTYNGVAFGSGAASDGSGSNFATMLTEPGSPVALPPTTRVTNLAVSGQGVGIMNNMLIQDVPTANNFLKSPLLPALMLGGGHDTVALTSSVVNDGTTRWPTVNYAANSVGQADEMYNGAPITATFDATMSNNTTALTVANLTGAIAIGSAITVAGGVSGLAVALGTASPFTTNVFQSPALAAVAATASLRSYQYVVQTVLSRGFKVVWGAEMAYAASDNAAMAEMRSKIVNNALADASAGPGQTYAGKMVVFDFSQITIGGSKPFGANYVGAVSTNVQYADGVHNMRAGKVQLLSGGDTPANGYRTNLTALA